MVIDSCVDIIHCLFLDCFLFISRTTLWFEQFRHHLEFITLNLTPWPFYALLWMQEKWVFPRKEYPRQKKKILTVFFKPFFRDETSVTDHSHAGQLKILFAKLYKFPQVRSPLHDKGFTPGKINLLHTCQLSDLYIKQVRLMKIFTNQIHI